MILLFSGGLDSFIAYHYLKKPKTLYFNLHTPYSQKELQVVKDLIPDTIIEDCLDMSDRQEGVHAYVPYRNLHLALLANRYSDTIIIAGLKDDKVNDKNEKVFQKFSSLMSYMMDRKILVKSPFWHQTKEDIVRWFLQVYGGSEVALLNTISCYSQEDTLYCGKCPACFRKWCALRSNGINHLPFHNRSLLDEYHRKASDGVYVSERNEAIIREIKRFYDEEMDV